MNGISDVQGVPTPAGERTATVVGFGQPFAGGSYMNNVIGVIGNYADGLLNAATNSYWEDNFTDKSPQKNRNYAQTFALTKEFIDLDNIEAAERQYLALIDASPFDSRGVMGVMDTRIRVAVAYGIIVDRYLHAAFHKRFECSNLNTAGPDCLDKEIEAYQAAENHARVASRIMMAMFADKQYRGVGQVLRSEINIESESPLAEMAAETRRIATNAVQRYAELQLDLAHLELLRAFASRRSMADSIKRLQDVQVYVTEASRALGAGAPLSHFGDNGLGRLQGVVESARSKQFEISQGINPFGFVADFVPFFDTGFDQHTGNVEKAKKLAQDLIADAASYENEAKISFQTLIAKSEDYQQAFTKARETYYDQLRTLCGVFVNPVATTESEKYEPDILTYFLPHTEDSDVEGWNTHIRDKIFQDTGRELISYGEIGIQHENIKSAQDRIRIAFNDWENLVEEMRITEWAGGAVSESIRGLGKIILANGQEFAFMEREKGRLQAEAEKAIASARKRASTRSFLTKVAVIGAAAAITVASGGSAGPIVAAIAATALTTNSEGDWQEGSDIVKAGLMFADYRYQAIAAKKESDIKAELAQKTAAINAAREELAALERAEVQFQRATENDIRTAERLKLLMLKRAKLELNLRIAERDLLREQLVLSNMYAKVDTLLAEYATTLKLLDQEGNDPIEGWRRPDVRVVSDNKRVEADIMFLRAQAATWLVVRATEYYLNGAMNSAVNEMRWLLYTARNAQHLESVLTQITTYNLLSENVFSQSGVQFIDLSLKYHILADAHVISTDPQNPSDPNSDLFGYFCSVKNQVIYGAEAYQAMLRDFLESAIQGNNLEFTFSTDILPRRPHTAASGEYRRPRNPLFGSGYETGKVISGRQPEFFTGSWDGAPGITINLIGEMSHEKYRVHLVITGDQIMRLTQPGSFTQENPMDGLVYYSSYEQKFPKSLTLNASYMLDDPVTLYSRRFAMLHPTTNGDKAPGVGDAHSMVFADRSVANSRWIFRIRNNEDSNDHFISKLREALNASKNPNVPFTYVRDIEFRIAYWYKGHHAN